MDDEPEQGLARGARAALDRHAPFRKAFAHRMATAPTGTTNRMIGALVAGPGGMIMHWFVWRGTGDPVFLVTLFLLPVVPVLVLRGYAYNSSLESLAAVAMMLLLFGGPHYLG